ncbi:hypothetical protein MKW92_020552 [Papaver armeniacum]|nr:hypothetical protein MKW92_020552 [Papaver armeniacum]
MFLCFQFRVLRLQHSTQDCMLGRLSSEVGWKLEEKRKARSQVAYERKKQLNKLRLKAEKSMLVVTKSYRE